MLEKQLPSIYTEIFLMVQTVLMFDIGSSEQEDTEGSAP